MQRGFGESVFEPEQARRDREITLGPITLIGLAVVLCGLCFVCFLWGYSLGGHRGATEPGATQEAANSATTAQLLSAQSKPAPNQNSVPPHTDPTSVVTGPAAGTTPTAAPVTASYPASSAPAAQQTGSVVQTALPAQPAAAQPAASGQVQSALTTAWMVQIAAVSHQEDADVLVSALRKRGYVVSARRDPEDNLLHVQVGPFSTHADAASMRQRLLNDGYNAIIEP